jgi:phage shock protein PspC (stress-responsive transcriptional regulator)
VDKIDRIHIAKVPYTIEAKAEIALKQYLGDIRSNLDTDTADDVMGDIELRIPELLLTRHVKYDGVIALEDVEYIQKQLGDPEQFLSDDAPERSGSHPKKLFRDMDSALVGGVASGIAKRLGLNVNLVRYGFLVFCILYGFGIVVYGVLWLLLPEAKTGTDKLLMSGEPVTAAALQRYRAEDENNPRRGPLLLQRIVVLIFRLLALFFTALISLALLTSFGVVSELFYIAPFRAIANGYGVDYVVLGLMWLGCICFIGLLVLLTARIWGYRSTRLNFSALILLVVFIIACAGFSTSGLLVYNHFSNKYGGNQDLRAISVTNQTPHVAPNALVIDSDSNLDITYFVTSQPAHASYESFPGMNRPNISVVDSNGTITVSSSQLDQAAPNCLGGLCKKIYLPVRVSVYGPAVSQIENMFGAILSINNANLGPSVTVKAGNASTTNIQNSSAGNLAITASNGAVVSADSTTAQAVTISADATSDVNSPVTDSLTATVPQSCLGGNTPSVISLFALPEHAVVNGQLQTPFGLNQDQCIDDGNSDSDYGPPSPPNSPAIRSMNGQ